MAAKIHPVILSGGSGTRLWPLSRRSFPKQFLTFASKRSLLQDTAGRVADPAFFAPPIMVCNEEHRFLVAEQLRQIDVVPGDIVLEPLGRNTAPAAAVAASLLTAADPDSLMLILPSDHVVTDPRAFRRAVETAVPAAAGGALVTFGIRPDRPETGYGYISAGKPNPAIAGCFAVKRFVEKPDRETAEKYIAAGDYYWNSGMFLFSASAYLAECGRYAADIAIQAKTALAGATRDLDFLRLDRDAFAASPADSIDYAVLERTDKAAVVPAEMGWNDVGAWDAIWKIGTKDADGNVLEGDVLAIDTVQSLITADEGAPFVAVLGAENMAVIATGDAVLVMPVDRAQDVKRLTDRLQADKRPELLASSRVYRPWGFYQTVHDGARFQVKRITVNPGASISLQRHHHRAEHWIVVNGVAEVTKDGETLILHENESVYLPPLSVHRLANPGKVALNIIEVQSGGYLGEDDIERFEDAYGRN